MLTIFVSLMGLGAKENGEFNQYKNLRSKYNPLYEQGCFRKKRSAVLSELKGRYRCQVYTLIQSAVFLSYGLLSIIMSKRWYGFEILMVMLMWIPGMVQNALQDGYERILKTGLQKKHKQKVWKAFSVEGREETVKKIQLENISSQDIEKQIEKLCSKNGYLLWEAYEKGRTKAKLFFREQENRLDIFLHVKSNEENIIGFCEEMNVAVQYFLKEYYSAKLNHPLLNLEALIYAKEAEAFHSLLAHTQTSTSGATQVLTVFSLKEKAFYISGWKKYIEKIGDGSFLQMLFKVLEINVK